MKSRFSAFAVGDIKYIIKTSLDENPDKLGLRDFSQNCEFRKLDILEFIDGEVEAFVTFRATIFCLGSDNSFTEKSKFVKKGNRWFYDSGEFQ